MDSSTIHRDIENDDFRDLLILGQPLTSGLFSHTKAEAIFQRVIDTVERQENELSSIRKLQTSLSTKVANDQCCLFSKVNKIEDQIEALLKRIEHVEKSISTTSSPSMTVGEGVTANRRTLIRTLNLLSTKVDSEELKVLSLSQEKYAHVVAEQLTRNLAPTVAIEKINEAMVALESRIDVICDDIRNKVDKSLFKTMSSEANSVRHYAEFVQTAEAALQKLDGSMDTITHTLSTHSETSKSLLMRTNELESKLEKKPEASMLHVVGLRLESIEATLNEKVKKCVIAQIDQISEESNSRVVSFEDDVKTLFAAHETLAKHLTKRLDVVVSDKFSITKFAEKKDVLDIIRKVSRDIDAKACNTSITHLNTCISTLKSDLLLTTKKADLAAQFIKLFSKGGVQSLQQIQHGRK